MREYFLTTDDRELWQKFLPERGSVYGSWGYAVIAEKHLHRKPRLHVVENEDGWIAYPMHLRPLGALPFGVSCDAEWDSATPEFTGPRVFGNPAEALGSYNQIRSRFALREGITAEFAHLHPWSGAEQLLGDGSSVNREIIWCDSSQSPLLLRQEHLEHRRRKALNKAEQKLRIVDAESLDQVRTFVRIYRSTMSRNDADQSYHFDEDHFWSFRQHLPRNARFTLSMYGDRAVGGLLAVYDDENLYAYLGGSDVEFFEMNAATLQIWDAVCWAHRTGRKRVILGGGFKKNDGIFHFKRSFSPLVQPFYTYKRIHRQDVYTRLERACREHYLLGDLPIEYFPAYRYVPKGSQAMPHSRPSTEAQPVVDPEMTNRTTFMDQSQTLQ